MFFQIACFGHTDVIRVIDVIDVIDEIEQVKIRMNRCPKIAPIYVDQKIGYEDLTEIYILLIKK